LECAGLDGALDFLLSLWERIYPVRLTLSHRVKVRVYGAMKP